MWETRYYNNVDAPSDDNSLTRVTGEKQLVSAAEKKRQIPNGGGTFTKLDPGDYGGGLQLEDASKACRRSGFVPPFRGSRVYSSLGFPRLWFTPHDLLLLPVGTGARPKGDEPGIGMSQRKKRKEKL